MSGRDAEGGAEGRAAHRRTDSRRPLAAPAPAYHSLPAPAAAPAPPGRRRIARAPRPRPALPAPRAPRPPPAPRPLTFPSGARPHPAGRPPRPGAAREPVTGMNGEEGQSRRRPALGAGPRPRCRALGRLGRSGRTPAPAGVRLGPGDPAAPLLRAQALNGPLSSQPEPSSSSSSFLKKSFHLGQQPSTVRALYWEAFRNWTWPLCGRTFKL